MKRWRSGIIGMAMVLAIGTLSAAQQPNSFGGDFADLTPQQQRLIANWVERFNQVTGQDADAEAFYDDLVKLSTKTTFDAVTHALMTSTLTDASGAALGTALDLIDTLETVKGKIKGASGDQQFRIYVTLKADAVETLERSREFKRGTDNTIFR